MPSPPDPSGAAQLEHTSLDVLASVTVVDLSQPLGPATPSWPGASPLRARVVADFDTNGFYDREVELPEHVGTHLDAPGHFAPDGLRAGELPARRLVVPAVVFDVRSFCGDDRDATVGAEELRGVAPSGLPMRGFLALIRTGWDRFVDEPAHYVGTGVPPRFPGLGDAGAEYLIELGAIGIGIDTLGVEPGIATSFPLHRITLPAGLFHLEGLVNLGELPLLGAWVVVGVLPLVDGSGAPARVLALVP